MRTIALPHGKQTIVDEDMFDFLSNFRWSVNSSGYAGKTFYIGNGKFIWFAIHHVISGSPLYKNVIDHINGNPLDNRRSNLRIVTRRQNGQNAKIHRSGRLPGTHFRDDRGKWRAIYSLNNKQVHIGYFETENEAHQAYLSAVEKVA